jgi:hypothetical protein
MQTGSDDPLHAFRWQPDNEAADLVSDLISLGVQRCPATCRMADRLRETTGTRLVDWIESIDSPSATGVLQQLIAAGFVASGMSAERCSYHRQAGRFPAIHLNASDRTVRLTIAVESLSDLLAAQALAVPIAGSPGSTLRQARLAQGDAAELWAVERHGDARSQVSPASPAAVLAGQSHFESLRLRRRDQGDEEVAFRELDHLFSHAIADCGRDLACDIFFAAERDFWQRRNRAGRVQKAHQDAVGLGWANHDHHTYRSSRRCFARMIALFERLGLRPRERFYPGATAGWGAQVLEQPVTGVVVFADVDMSAEELRQDFAHQPFPDDGGVRSLGTVGLWCALHGESLFSAGMHHLACRVDITAATALLAHEQVRSMPPFSELPHLKQSFTEGELWRVSEERLEPLVQNRQITSDQAQRFRSQGALGSHLELVERNAGFKGFNQHGVDEIIAGTDPRRGTGH